MKTKNMLGVVVLLVVACGFLNCFTTTCDREMYNLDDTIDITFCYRNGNGSVVMYCPFLPPFIAQIGDYAWCEGTGPGGTVSLSPYENYIVHYQILASHFSPGRYGVRGGMDSGFGDTLWVDASPDSITIGGSINDFIDVTPSELVFDDLEDLEGLQVQLSNTTSSSIDLNSYDIDAGGYEPGYTLRYGDIMFPRILYPGYPLTMTVIPNLARCWEYTNTMRVYTDLGPITIPLRMDEALASQDAAPPTPALALSGYPNPFNPTTTIAYSLPQAGEVRLDVYDIRGRLVERLAHERQPASEHSVEWDAQNRSSGVYLARLVVDGQPTTTKLLLLK